MAKTTVAHFAAELKLPVGDLLSQLRKAGLHQLSGNDYLNDDHKSRLLEYLRSQRVKDASQKKIVLVRKDQPPSPLPESGVTSNRLKIIIRRKFSGVGKPSIDDWMAMSASDRQSYRIDHRGNDDLRWHIESLDAKRRATLTEMRKQSRTPAPQEAPIINSVNVCCVTKPVPVSKELEQHLRMMELLERED